MTEANPQVQAVLLAPADPELKDAVSENNKEEGNDEGNKCTRKEEPKKSRSPLGNRSVEACVKGVDSMKVDARLNTGVLTNRPEHHVSQHSLLRRPILDLAAINFDAIRKLPRLRKLPLIN